MYLRRGSYLVTLSHGLFLFILLPLDLWYVWACRFTVVWMTLYLNEFYRFFYSFFVYSSFLRIYVSPPSFFLPSFFLLLSLSLSFPFLFLSLLSSPYYVYNSSSIFTLHVWLQNLSTFIFLRIKISNGTLIVWIWLLKSLSYANINFDLSLYFVAQQFA